MTEYIFGPQGHPASFRIAHFKMEEDEREELTLFFFNDEGGISMIAEPFSEKRLEQLKEFGQRINEQFSGSCFWWRCEPSCVDPSCPECEKIREKEQEEANKWFRENPIP